MRSPGQSIQAEIDNLWVDEAWRWVTIIGFAVVFVVLEWSRVWFQTPPRPWLVTGLAVVAIAYSVYRIRLGQKQIAALTLGLQGERTVAEILDDLRASGAKVLHDIPGDGFNVDHVVVASRGIFAIETKTISRPPGAKITFNRGRVFVDGRPLDRDPVVQAKAGATWIRGILEKSTGKSFPVRPVVLFPGWFVEPMSSPNAPDIWVLNSAALPRFFANEAASIPEDDVSLAAFHLSLYVKAAGERG